MLRGIDKDRGDWRLVTYPYGDDHLVRLTLMPDLKGVL